ncbi:hypothetical protein B0H67DRAFT_490963 [Lasiosphaeris hirsuta]|uniref:DUF7703 domain-containing protein n=1 Tax=Lasiosphaeris hirsuta TaxID=260670 RepID=A0AA40AIA0_9PEZI|nr:hypothetical protein B0H67DRAFT_490963 [Lasiosphaeris hirsuta]
MTVAGDSGIGADDATDQRTLLIIVCLLVVALYNVLELNVIIFSTFKTRRGLYFWSFLVATWGIPFYATGFLLKFIVMSRMRALIVVLISIGWCCMVTGQSVVLYSRLQLVLWNQKHLRFVLAMIIFDAIVCHIPTIVMAAGANTTNSAAFIGIYSVYEKVQVTIFFIQELTISALYISGTAKLLETEDHVRGGRATRASSFKPHLILVNAVVIVLDITVLVLEYSKFYDIQTSYKAFTYSVKLKLEFSILNRLVELTKSVRSRTFNQSDGPEDLSLNTINGSCNMAPAQKSQIGESTVCVYVSARREVEGATAGGASEHKCS